MEKTFFYGKKLKSRFFEQQIGGYRIIEVKAKNWQFGHVLRPHPNILVKFIFVRKSEPVNHTSN